MKSRKTDNESPRRERRTFTDEFERHAVRRQVLSHYSSYHSLPSWTSIARMRRLEAVRAMNCSLVES